ncbi:protein of unknown function [Pseudomonas sp. JV551A1]|uniref:Uncharacterized protein n=1 Tax=Pseudomonas inefficax TaxID=2078786 RepID=A0AAQ1PEK8_9PSED|nr:protein of unknown function [Pseudomonas sp. JV551A1]SPO62994.1 protein of unknown function [Pseudomonas inefficax]
MDKYSKNDLYCSLSHFCDREACFGL